jgi:peroxiredoxin family protein
MPEENRTDKTIMVFSSDLDKVMAAYNIAIGSASVGFTVHMFFTFWGVNILRKENANVKDKSLIEKMFAFMMPEGSNKLTLSKMNMGGIGTWMMKQRMKSKHIAMLPELIQTAKEMGVNMIACQMTMDMMGIKREELMDGISFAGVVGYLDRVEQSNLNLFI